MPASPSWGQPNLRYDTLQDPFLFLLREPAVQEELRLSDQQRQALVEVNDRFDGPLLALRIVPADKAQEQLTHILTETRREAQRILNDKQQKRLAQIVLRTRGIDGLRDESLSTHLALTSQQRTSIDAVLEDARKEIGKLYEQAQQGDSTDELNEEYRRLREQERTKVLGLLTPYQRTSLTEALGPLFDVGRLGHVSFKAPELAESKTWFNAEPMRIADLQGRVVALHFWTFG